MSTPTVRFVLLALLGREPATGQELAQRLRDPVGFFWSAPHSQIYPQLAALVTDGLVRFDVESAGAIRPRKRYRLTPKGRRELRRWLASTPDRQPPRDEVMVRAYAVSLADRSRATRLYAELAARAEARIGEYESLEAQLRADHGVAVEDPSYPAFGNWSVLQAGLLAERARVQWCHWMVGRLTDDH
ncbi:PadR family transcriptional regulator [Calidifontibacter sp. DB0510]|uniref:PadR family transcriptional regulator n=1 Tax=Metallococcus carri TaxID=1656884 RepID=A0A967B019_9MICO|nr:PadR family transcriptional regulator [Metallococcus carri]NHN56279.1 PadR family transcriptional regulator [Metallococcus carri]NOP38669.1 PadR family transcriptional regulator [Calidifontibacter sp. DB2511S]